MSKMKVSKALKLLKENGFTLLHRKSSHMKFGKGSLRVVITDGGWKGTGELHSKQEKELQLALAGKDNPKHLEQLENEKTNTGNYN